MEDICVVRCELVKEKDSIYSGMGTFGKFLSPGTNLSKRFGGVIPKEF